MKSIGNLLDERFKKGPSHKMATLAQRAGSGELSSFSGLFQVQELSLQDKESIENSLRNHRLDASDLTRDLSELLQITSEIKAISHQAALLHGERISRAQKIFKNYKEGAFSSWLVSAYGNRQTPYNLLLFYLFVDKLSAPLKEVVQKMPRQAIYTLAAREGDFEKKLALISSFNGETKETLLEKIRTLFPLEENDARRENPFIKAVAHLEKATSLLTKKRSFSAIEKETLRRYLKQLESML